MDGELSPALLARTRRFAPHSRQICASSPRLRCVTRTLFRPTPPTNRSLHRTTSQTTGPRAKRAMNCNRQESMNHRGRAERPDQERPARLASVRLISLGAPPFAPPRFWLHLPSRIFEKSLENGRALSPPPRTTCGGRGSQFWLRSRELFCPPPSAQSYRHVVPPGALRCPRGWWWLL